MSEKMLHSEERKLREKSCNVCKFYEAMWELVSWLRDRDFFFNYGKIFNHDKLFYLSQGVQYDE